MTATEKAEGRGPSNEEDEEEEELRGLEQLRLEEEAARKRREEFEEAQRRRKEQREQEERKRKDEEEEERRRKEEEESREATARGKLDGGAATEGAAKAEEKFDDLERRLEEEERRKRPAASAALPATVVFAAEGVAAASALAKGDAAELQIYVGKWVACDVLGPGSKPDTFCVHVVPTTLFDNAAGRSDKDVPDVPLTHLRKVAAPASSSALAATEEAAPPPAEAEAEAQPNSAPACAVAAGGAAAAAAGGGGGFAASPGGEGGGAAAAGGACEVGEGGGEVAPKSEEDVALAVAAVALVMCVGSRVVVRGLADKPQLDGVTGTLIEKKWKGNWIVDLDDEEGKKRRLRRRWLINDANLEVSDKPEMKKYSAENGRPKQQYYIVGTWNDFVPRRMTWDHDRCCWTFEARVGSNGFECFQIWLDRDKKKAVHPDTANAGNYVPWELCGPDAHGDNKNWSFGDGSENVRFEVRLFLWEDESPQAVEWGDVELAKKKAAEDGSETKEALKKCPKNHDLKTFKPPVEGYTCSRCKSSYPKGASFFSCRPCDYDVCEACSSGSKATPCPVATDDKASVGGANGVGILQDARKFLSGCEQDAGSVGGAEATVTESEPTTAKAAEEALRVGDRVTITSAGPYRGRQGAVMKVDEDGDPAVRLDSGEAKLFYRVDVNRLPPQAAAAAAAGAAAKGLGKGNGTGKGVSRGLGVLGFRGGTSGLGA